MTGRLPQKTKARAPKGTSPAESRRGCAGPDKPMNAKPMNTKPIKHGKQR